MLLLLVLSLLLQLSILIVLLIILSSVRLVILRTHFFWGSQLSIIIRTLCLRVHCPLSFSFLSDIRSPFDQSSEERLFLPRQWQVPLHLTLNRVELRLFLSKRNLRIFYDLDRHVRSPISLCSSASSTFPPNSNHNYQPRFLRQRLRQSLGGRPLCLFLSNRLPRRARLLLALRAGCLRFSESSFPNSYDPLTVDVLHGISCDGNFLGP